MMSEEFTSFNDAIPEKYKHIIVTNNIDVKNVHGEMSHIWLTTFWTESINKEKGIMTFDDSDSEIINLTHWKYA